MAGAMLIPQLRDSMTNLLFYCIIKKGPPCGGPFDFAMAIAYLLQELPQQLPHEVPQLQLGQLQSLQQQPAVLLCELFILLVAYNEAPASIIAAVTPMIIFFIVSIFKIYLIEIILSKERT